MKRLLVNSAALSAGSYVGQGANAVLYVLAARAYGPGIFGALVAVIGVAIVVASFADFGVNGLTTRALARDPNSVDPFVRTFTAKLLVAALMTSAWLVIATVAARQTPMFGPYCLVGGYLALLILENTLVVPFRAAQNMFVVGAISAIEKCSALVAWMLMGPIDATRVDMLPLALSFGCAIGVICAFALIPARFRSMHRPSLNGVANLWRASFGFGMTGVASQILRADVAIVSSVAGPYAAGVYAAPARLAGFLTVIPASFSAALFPRLAGASDGRTAQREGAIAGAAVILILGVGLVAIGIGAQSIVVAALGAGYSASANILRIYLGVVIITSINQPLLAYLQARGHEGYAGRATFVAVLFGLLAIAGGAQVAGGVGAACGALALQAMFLVLLALKTIPTFRRSRSFSTPSVVPLQELSD